MLNLHAGGWGPPKTGKTHIGLSARSHEVRLPGKKSDVAFAKPEPGEVVIPSKALTIAFANFDRPADTVFDEIPRDYDIVEERFFEDEHGEQIWVPDDATVLDLLRRLQRFVTEAAGEVDLFLLDGATVIWENVRQVRLGAPAGKDPDGLPHHLPRQYGEANAEMRMTVMQLLYAADFHSWITLEAGEKWDKASGPVMDPFGNPVLRLDGWNKTGHYCDVLGQTRFVEKRDGQGNMHWVREYIPGPGSIKAQMIGQVIEAPTFADIYRRAFPNVPLLRREDREEYARLLAKHGDLLW